MGIRYWPHRMIWEVSQPQTRDPRQCQVEQINHPANLKQSIQLWQIIITKPHFLKHQNYSLTSISEYTQNYFQVLPCEQGWKVSWNPGKIKYPDAHLRWESGSYLKLAKFKEATSKEGSNEIHLKGSKYIDIKEGES